MRGLQASKNWSHYWFKCPISLLATLQLCMSLGMAGMEVGNTLVDLYNANVYSGFWSFPFMLAATIATYVTVCPKSSQNMAIVALICQGIAILVLLIAGGFLIAFIATGFNKCIGIQCGVSTNFYSTSGSFSPSDSYYFMKTIFISCELAFAIIFILLAIVYIYLFIICLHKLSYIHRQKFKLPFKGLVSPKSSSVSPSPVRPLSISSMSSINSPLPMLIPDKHESMSNTSSHSSSSEQIKFQPVTIAVSYFGARQVCPECKHVSPYLLQRNIVKCPKCSYESRFIQRAQKK